MLFLQARQGFLLFLPVWENSIWHTSYQHMGMIKKWTAAAGCMSTCDVIVMLNYVTMSHVCHISVYSGFSGRLFSCFSNIKWGIYYLVMSKKKNPLFVWGWDRKICPSQSPFVITWQASWCQSVILGTDFSIPPLHSWWILIIAYGTGFYAILSTHWKFELFHTIVSYYRRKIWAFHMILRVSLMIGWWWVSWSAMTLYLTYPIYTSTMMLYHYSGRHT